MGLDLFYAPFARLLLNIYNPTSPNKSLNEIGTILLFKQCACCDIGKPAKKHKMF